jgi:LacI family transcriptional regulator
MVAKAPTVYDVAERSGVSIATVSRVFRSPATVREHTRERVLAAVNELGYVPSAAARGLAARRTNVIGLFFPGHDETVPDRPVHPARGDTVPIVDDDADRFPDAENLYFDEVLRGAEIEAWRRGFALMVAAGRGTTREALVTDIAGRVDGLAVLARTVPDELLAYVARRIPVVILAGAQRADDFDHVSASNGPGMRTLANYVLQTHGVQDVIYIAGPADSPDDAERLSGFRSALADSGVAEADVPIVQSDFTREGGRRSAMRILAQRQPRGILCSNDETALGVLDVLEQRGIRVPEDVLVTGFDGIAAGRTSRPPLTTVHQPMVELGRAAVHAITTRLDDPSLTPQSFTLPVEVVLRASCPRV